MHDAIKKQIEQCLVSLCSPNTVSEFKDHCTSDVVLHLPSGKKVVGLPAYLDLLSKIHESFLEFHRTIISSVCEKTADGYQIILHTKNKVVPRDSKKASVEFDDFIKIHVNSLGKMDALWQGSGVHQNMMPHIS